jgi:hypothetical protein
MGRRRIEGLHIVVGVDPRRAAHEAGQAVEQRVLDALLASAATTDPGPTARVQGNLR